MPEGEVIPGEETPAVEQPAKRGNAAPKGEREGSALLEKIESLQRDLSGEREKLKRTEKERDEFKGKATGYELKDKKLGHLTTALDTLGDDFAIESEKLKAIRSTVERLPDSEDLADVIAGLVGAVKQPKGAGSKPAPFTGPPDKNTGSGSGSGPVGDKKPGDYNDKELDSIYRDDRARYDSIMTARREGSLFK
jgi:hypothetical protein